MALDVEDGTGLAIAESYVTVAEIRTYATKHNTRYTIAANVADTTLEASARIATIFLDGKGRDKRNSAARWWPGSRINGAQALAWPRQSATYTDGTAITDPVPIQIKRATMELACYDNLNPGIIGEIITLTDVVKKEKVGPVEIEYVGRAQDIESARPVFSLVEDYIAQIIRLPEVADGTSGTTTSANFNFNTIGD